MPLMPARRATLPITPRHTPLPQVIACLARYAMAGRRQVVVGAGIAGAEEALQYTLAAARCYG